MVESTELTALPESRSDLQVPYSGAAIEFFGEKYPDQKQKLARVLERMDRDALDNFRVYSSERFPGVSFSYTKFTLDENTLFELSGIHKKENEEDQPKKDFFLFIAASYPPGGHPFWSYDMAIDRYIRCLPALVGAFKRGEIIPQTNIYLLGVPHGFGGSVTPDWLETVKNRGLESQAELYAEFITVCEKDADAHLVLQGVSKGAVVAEKTSKFLPQNLQSVTQRLLDNPVGYHRGKLKGVQVAAGFLGEFLAKALFDRESKRLAKLDDPFLRRLSEKTGIALDDHDQVKFKKSVAMAEIFTLLKGLPMDLETRSLIRKAIFDPTTFGPKRIYDIWSKQKEIGERPVFFSKGKSLEAPFKDFHSLIYNNFRRWDQILTFLPDPRENT